jgi:DNA-binding NarL/FixJ family response regulator
VQLIEHAGLGPLGKAPPAGRRGAAAQLTGGQQPPRGRGAGHEHDRGQALLSPTVTRRLIEEFTRQPRRDRSRPDELAGLTAREVEVAKLVGRGLSNAEIADTLVLAEQTVKTHVGRILAKLGLRDRAQVVVAAYESGLISPGEGR